MSSVDLYDSPEFPSAARRFLFRDTTGNEAPSDVVRWWEKRRLGFNIAVGSAGVASLSALWFLSAIGPRGEFMGGPPLIGIIAYGLAANVMYTGGWIAELGLRRFFGRRTGTVGATIFRYGLVFSVGLTLLPIGVGLLGLAIRTLGYLFGMR